MELSAVRAVRRALHQADPVAAVFRPERTFRRTRRSTSSARQRGAAFEVGQAIDQTRAALASGRLGVEDLGPLVDELARAQGATPEAAAADDERAQAILHRLGRLRMRDAKAAVARSLAHPRRWAARRRAREVAGSRVERLHAHGPEAPPGRAERDAAKKR